MNEITRYDIYFAVVELHVTYSGGFGSRVRRPERITERYRNAPRLPPDKEAPVPETDSHSHSVITRRRALGVVVALAAGGAAVTFAGTRAGTETPAHWDYEAEGPGHWAELDRTYRVCGTGHAQSPVDLPSHTQSHPDEHIEIEYGMVAITESVNNGHTVQTNLPAGNGNRIVVDGRPHELTQFHFHAPGEHTVDGHSAGMEFHLVHKDASGALAVLAILLEPGDGSPFAPLLTALPAAPGSTVRIGPVDLRSLLPTDRAQFRYTGSLTTPPCTEGVSWTVLRSPLPVSGPELDRYRSLFAHTNRPVQPLNGRPVTLAGG
ncbi:carbonic anhydrase [Nocardia carnea]|uniref:carbonic anhydrase n=1 Tax=Nocardia carnea TaxID=37328 RepID=UPI0024556655|nr:carbonic anhydrase family protein [Nocardia carnea]